MLIRPKENHSAGHSYPRDLLTYLAKRTLWNDKKLTVDVGMLQHVKSDFSVADLKAAVAGEAMLCFVQKDLENHRTITIKRQRIHYLCSQNRCLLHI